MFCVPIVPYLYVCKCSDGAREKMQKEYLSDPNYSFEKMNHASKACGPLVQWAIAQVQQYSEDTCKIFVLMHRLDMLMF